MRYQGMLIEWNAERGFGFVRRHGDADGKVFVHVRAFGSRGVQPRVGDVVTYAVERDGHGRPRAADVAFATAPSRSSARRPAGRDAARRKGDLRVVVAGVALLALGAFAWTQYQAHPSRPDAGPPTSSAIHARRPSAPAPTTGLAPLPGPDATTAIPPASRVVPMRGPSVAPLADSAGFTCSGKQRCSQMASCAEATFYLRHCPGTITDGDGDGIPCEDQWCGH